MMSSRPGSAGIPRGRPTESGGASTLAVVLVGVLAVVALLVGTVAGVLTDQRRVESAADLAALAGAAAHQEGEDACPAAEAVAQRNDAELASCRVDGDDVRVAVRREARRVLGRRVAVSSEALAGPAEASR
jgi:secretion/DNA translocation related TadE-like protein